MRRSFAGVLLALGVLALGVAISGWFLQRSTLDPPRAGENASAIVADPQIRHEISSRVATVTAKVMKVDTMTVEAIVSSVADHPRSGPLFAKLVTDAQAHLIGVRERPVVLTNDQLAGIVRTQVVGTLPQTIVPVPYSSTLDLARQIVRWAVPGAALVGLILVLLALSTRPDRSTVARGLGVGLVGVGALTGIFGYLVPRFLVAFVSDSVWARIPARLADADRAKVIAIVGVSFAVSVALLASAGMLRRERRWSAPVNMGRYSEQRGWR